MDDDELRRQLRAYAGEIDGQSARPPLEQVRDKGMKRSKRAIGYELALVVAVSLLAMLIVVLLRGHAAPSTGTGNGHGATVVPHSSAYTGLMVWVWLGGAVLFTAVEVFTLAFFALFVAVGMLGGVLTAAVGAPVWAQAFAAAAVSVAGLTVARPRVMHALEHHGHRAIGSVNHGPVGQDAITVDEVGDSHHPGHVLYAGERWLATTEAPDGIPPDVQVTVMEVRGTTLVVWP